MMRKGRILSGAGSVGLHAVLSLGLALLVPLTARAASTHTPEQEYADLTKVDQAVSPLGDHPFGARIGLYDGSLSFLQTDVSLAGNGPTLSLSRAYIVRGVDGLDRRAKSALGDWQLALPRLETLVPHQGLAGIDGWMVEAFAGPSWYRCRDFAAAPTAPAQGGTGHREWTATDYWQGYQLIVPGHGSQHLLRANATVAGLINDPDEVVVAVTKGQWKLSCIAEDATANGEPGDGFIATAPDGTRYTFNELVYFPAPAISRELNSVPTLVEPQAATVDSLQRQRAELRVTTVTDRNGHSLTYHYDSAGKLTGISASDGRELAIAYVAGTPRIDHVTLMPDDPSVPLGERTERTWNYAYDGFAHLTSVTRPDNQQWQFDLDDWDGLSTATGIASRCSGLSVDSVEVEPSIGTLTAPSGLVGTFAIDILKHGRAWVPKDCLGEAESGQPYDGRGTWAKQPKAWFAFTLTERSVSGPGVNANWSYHFADPEPSWAIDCTGTTPCADTTQTTVDRPDGSQLRLTYSTHYGITEGQLLTRETLGSVDLDGNPPAAANRGHGLRRPADRKPALAEPVGR